MINLVAFKIQTEDKSLIINRSDIAIPYKTDNLTDAFNFLMKEENIILIAWNLDEEISPLLKLLSKEQCIKLQKTGRTNHKDHKIFYIQAKLFSITSSRYSEDFKPRNCYHIKQYYPDYPDSQSIEQTLEYGQNIMQALKIMNLTSYKLSSPVAIYEDRILNNITLPTIQSSNITKQAAEYAWRCSGKLWIEAFKLGKFDNCFDYDISGAFPTFAKDMIDTTGAIWINDNKFHPEATYGFCKGWVTINDNVTVSPIIYENDKGELSTPTGTWNTFLTKSEIEFIDKWNIGHFEIENGWWCICKNPNKKPLENVTNRLLAFKKHSNPMVRLLAKRMSVGGLYGKFGEEHKNSFGRHFNPVYFAMISTLCRLEVARFIYENKCMDNLISVAVDGVLLDKKLTIGD